MNTLKSAIAALALATIPAFAGAEEPIITFHTSIYETYGTTNSFHITLGATEDTYIDIDYGFGATEELIQGAKFDSDAGEMTGTPIQITVSAAGNVAIYGDASKIDYIDFEGCYITDLSFPTLTNVEILNLKHNELRQLDLSHMTKLAACYLDDNPFTEATPLVVGAPKPGLIILSMSMTGWVSPSFDISDYPALRSFEAYDSPSITRLTPSGCPDLLQLSVDGTNVSSIDVTKNPNLLILNLSETRVTDIDVSRNPYLTELYVQHEAALNQNYKLQSIDISKNPELQRLYLNGNNLAELDLSNNPKIVSFACRRNHIKSLNFDNIPNMTLVDISLNDMNFNTMPLPRATFTEYGYNQNPLPAERSYPVGTTLDYTAQVIRPDGSTTDAALFGVNRENPGAPYLLSSSFYTWDNGKITLNAACADSVYVAFHNSEFPEYDLTTSRFMVKSADAYGKPTAIASFRTPSTVQDISFFVGLEGASASQPIDFQVDFGDGILTKFSASSASIDGADNVSGTRKGLTTTIYVDENVDITALAIKDFRLTQLKVTEATTLRQLIINNCGLTAVDLSWNRALDLLDLSGNSLTAVDLSEPNAYYAKTELGDIYLGNNKISNLTLVDPYGLRNLDVSSNQLVELPLTHATGLLTLNVADNQLSEINLTDCEALTELNVAGNKLSELYIPDYAPIHKLNVSRNALPFSQLPLPGSLADYTYAPQLEVAILAKAPTVSLAKYEFDYNSQSTEYVWHYTSDGSVVSPDQYTENHGRFVFKNSDLGSIYCTITNPAFPQLSGEFAIRTSNMQTLPPPTHVFATLGVADSSDDVTIRLAAVKDNHAVYIDWEGYGNMEQYVLYTQYQEFGSAVQAGNTIRCYSYDEQDGVTVFSLTAPLASADVSKMSDLNTLSLSSASLNLDNIKMPEQAVLKELNLNGCDIPQISLDKLPGLTMLSLNNTGLTAIDASPCADLEVLYLTDNPLTSVKLNNPKLWELDLNNCGLTELDLSGVPSMRQLWLTNNNLTHIDVSMLSGLYVMFIDQNRFDFNTLPRPSESYYLYNYVNQKPLTVEPTENKVDLSQYATVDGVATKYQWFIDAPYFDENGNLVGEDLYIDEEYTLENGVTTFLEPFNNVMCVMTNDVFPNLYLYTNLMDVKFSGVEDVETEPADAKVVYYNLQGVRIDNPSAGIYVRVRNGKSDKVYIR